MRLLDDLRGYARFAGGLRQFLKQSLSLDDGRRILGELRADRNQNFIHLLEHGVFTNPANPYMRMMAHAGLAPAGVLSMIHADGIEHTLRSLYKAGVYLTFEEFKGRKPVVRGSLEFSVTPADFENPYAVSHYETTTSGSTGIGTRIPHDLEYQRLIAVFQNLALACEHNIHEFPRALWYGILPDGTGVNSMLRLTKFGHTPDAWFTPNRAQPLRAGFLKFAVVSYLLVIVARVFGVPAAWPRYTPLDQPETVLRWAERTLKKHGRCLVITSASRGLRVGLAAQRAGVDLTGAVFALGGEPVTHARLEGIKRVGAAAFSLYGNEESGVLGIGCADPVSVNDVHLNQGMFHAYSQPIEVPGFSDPVAAISLTSLHPSSPFIFINYLSDDYGVIEERECDCGLGRMGFNLHIRSIFSYSKLTGEGVTLAGSDMLHVLEDILPKKFGGSMLDYQLEEVEDETGFIRFNLLISPGISIANEQDVIDEMLGHLRRKGVAADMAQDIWRQANTVRIVRADPVWSERGKFFSIRKLTRS